MSVLSSCLSIASIENSNKEFESSIGSIVSTFNTSVNSIMASEDYATLNSVVSSSLDAANTLFEGKLSSVLTDTGISETVEESRKNIMTEGYYCGDSRVYFVCTPTWKSHDVVSNSSYKYLGVSDGEYSSEEINNLFDYSEPEYESVITNIHKSKSFQVNLSSSAVSAKYDGDIEKLREMYIGYGSNLDLLTQGLSSLSSCGYLIQWSIIRYAYFLRPNSVSEDDFTENYVKNNFSKYIRSSDIIKVTNNKYIVLYEDFIAENVSKHEAYLSGIKSGVLTSNDKESYITPRIFTKTDTNDLVNGSPYFVSKGFNQSALSTNCHNIGIIVNGIARVVDVTSDEGNRLTNDVYTPSIIAESIRTVFPDLVETGSCGDEWYIKLKDSSSTAYLGFFCLDSLDAKDAIGISSSLSENYGINFSNDDVSFFEITSGSSTSDVIPTNLISRISSLGLTSYQISSILSDRSTYWNDAESYINSLYSSIEKITKDNISENISYIKSLFPIVNFYFIDNVNVQDSLNIISILGDSEMERVIKLTDVVAFDIFTSSNDVYTTMQNDINKLTSGVVSKSLSNVTITATPRDVNYSKASLLYIDAIVATDSDNSDQTIDEYVTSLLNEISDLTASTSSVSEVATSEMMFDSLENLASRYIRVINSYPSTSEGIVNGLSEYVASATVSFLRSNTPSVYNSIIDAKNAISEIGDDYSEASSEAYSYLKDLESWFASEQSSGVKVLHHLLVILNYVEPTIRVYAAAYQETYSKLSSLVGINKNLYASFGKKISTKLVTCYISGDSSLALSLYSATLLKLINAAVDAINKVLDSMTSSIDSFIKKITCIVDAFVKLCSGNLSYTSTMSVAGISLKFNCVSSSLGLSSVIDPRLLELVVQIANRIKMLLSLFKVQTIAIAEQKKSTSSQLTKQTVSQLLLNTYTAIDNDVCDTQATSYVL